MTASTQEIRTYPLLFGFGEVVMGRGFVAGVAISHGRILARQEDEGWWLDGVNPGAIAEGAKTLYEAVAKFRSTFRAVLSDFADAANSFNEFERRVMDFFNATDDDTVREWDDAREVVRSSKSAPLDLQIDKFDPSKMRITVKVISAPRENLVQEDAPAVAA